jgi:hypothetical protein
MTLSIPGVGGGSTGAGGGVGAHAATPSVSATAIPNRILSSGTANGVPHR